MRACETYAEALRKKSEWLTEDEKATLAAYWCSGLIPHPPVYYMPKEQAQQLVSSLGLDPDKILATTEA